MEKRGRSSSYSQGLPTIFTYGGRNCNYHDCFTSHCISKLLILGFKHCNRLQVKINVMRRLD